ncbi:uncharacterized protein LOC120345523 [Styela clava]|uniref:uncharacterized protein LOC120345523 n=1 Tax=Styela clava TaxID=7725 RepID=UPI00193A2E75|nr:uncharacterized protein LOC120345523 [Styela clava]
MEYQSKYENLKRKLKILLYEQESFKKDLEKSQHKLLRVSRDKSFLLDRLLLYEQVSDDSSSDTDATLSSDCDTSFVTKKKNASTLIKGELERNTTKIEESSGTTLIVKSENTALDEHTNGVPDIEIKRKEFSSTTGDIAPHAMDVEERKKTTEDTDESWCDIDP